MPQDTTLNSDGCTAHLHGNGRPIMLLHGNFGDGHFFLPEQPTLTAVALRHFGEKI
ncbi:MAG: hypothetical protein FWD53_08650 [Phycisphaerales bacterium]|nr:hypothetical protein [Phycisphaerales bacterium]